MKNLDSRFVWQAAKTLAQLPHSMDRANRNAKHSGRSTWRKAYHPGRSRTLSSAALTGSPRNDGYRWRLQFFYQAQLCDGDLPFHRLVPGSQDELFVQDGQRFLDSVGWDIELQRDGEVIVHVATLESRGRAGHNTLAHKRQRRSARPDHPVRLGIVLLLLQHYEGRHLVQLLYSCPPPLRPIPKLRSGGSGRE